MKDATHIFCDKYLCKKSLLPSGVSYEFDDEIPLEELTTLRNNWKGNLYKELPKPKPLTLHGYNLYQGAS